jgi:Flp pilus assembly protein TadD
MRRTIGLLVMAFLWSLGQAAVSQAADESPRTGEKRDTLLYVRTVPPGAKVLLDGKELGTSDDAFCVEPGVGTIVVELEGHKPNAKQVTIRANEVTRVELVLKPQRNAGAGRPSVPGAKTGPTSASGAGDATQLSQEGWRLWQQRRLDEAAAKFSQAVDLAPDNENAWNGLGWASFNLGKLPEAKKAFQRVIALNPNHPAALNGLGQLHLAQKEYDFAESYLLKAAPQAPAAWFGLARLYLLQGKFERAEKYAQMIVDSGQGDKVADRMLQAAKEKRLGDGLRIMIEPQPATPGPTAKGSHAEAEKKALESASPQQATAKVGTSPEHAAADTNGKHADNVTENILANPGAENGDKTPDSWEQGALPDGVAAIKGVKFSWDKRVAFQGKASLCIEKTANRYFPIAQWSQTVERKGDASVLEVSAQVKARRMTKAIVDVQFLDKNGQTSSHAWAAYIGIKQEGDLPADHDWQKYSGRVDIPPGTAKLRIGLQVYGPGKVWFDDIRARYAK